MTAAERYPNTKPRIMTPAIMSREGKAISCLGPVSRYRNLQEIWTIDGNGINECHMMDADTIKGLQAAHQSK